MPDLTVRELAERERVTRRTVYNWIEKGAVEHRRTPGGSIRIPTPDTPPAAVKITVKR